MNLNETIKLFDQIKKEWSEDCKIDFQFKNKEYTEDLASIALNIPYQHNKYLNYYSDLQQEKLHRELLLKKLIRSKREYYGGEADGKVYKEKPLGSYIKTAEKMKTFLEGDDDILALEGHIKCIDQVLYYVDNVMKQITNRGFQVKSAIEWEKFINGVT